MGSHAVTGSYIPQGVNAGNRGFRKAVLTASLANGETLTVNPPSGMDVSLVPTAVHCFTVSGDTWTRDTDMPLGVTTHDVGTGVSVLTATGNVASGAIVLIEYVAAA